MKKLIVILMILFVGILVAGCTTQQAAPATPAPTAAPTAAPTVAPMKNIVETAVADGRFTTLVAALQAAKLDTTLSGPGPFTVFAPTDDAFKKLPAGTVETLLKDPEGDLKQILLYHVVSGEVMSADAIKLTSAKTVKGDDITLGAKEEVLILNNGAAKVVTKDIKTSNGVIHVIDSVLLIPKPVVATPTPTPSPTPLPDYKIKIANTLTFEPKAITIPLGSKVIIYTDAVGYKFKVAIAGANSQAVSDIITPYQSYTFTATKAGSYTITETIYPQFRDQRVTVTVV